MNTAMRPMRVRDTAFGEGADWSRFAGAAVANGNAWFTLDGSGQPRAILRFPAASLRLQGPGVDRMLEADPYAAGSPWFLYGLAPADDQPGAVLTVSPKRLLPLGKGWDLGDGFTLQPFPVCSFPVRDWAWAWQPSMGPLILNLYIDRPRSELAEWIAGLAPIRFDEALMQLRVVDGGLQLLRSYHQPTPAQLEMAGGVLAQLAAGALGELSWDLLDGDYVYFVASGEDRHSLRAYLDGTSEAPPIPRRQVDARSAAGDADLARVLSLALGANNPESLLDWLRATPLASLPRHVEVRLGRQNYSLCDAIVSANPRVLWYWRHNP